MQHTRFAIPDLFIKGKAVIEADNISNLNDFLLECVTAGLTVRITLTIPWAEAEFQQGKHVFLRYGKSIFEKDPRILGVNSDHTALYFRYNLSELEIHTADASDFLDLL